MMNTNNKLVFNTNFNEQTNTYTYSISDSSSWMKEMHTLYFSADLYTELQIAYNNNDVTLFNKLLIESLNKKAPKSVKYVANKHTSSLYPTNEFHLEINNKIIEDPSFDYPFLDNDGYIMFSSINCILSAFKTSTFSQKVRIEKNIAKLLLNNKILHQETYAIYDTEDEDYLHDPYTSYSFKPTYTKIQKTYEVVRFLKNKKPLVQFNKLVNVPRNYDLIIVDQTKTNKQELTYTIASIRQILTNKLPAFRTIKKQDKQIDTDATSILNQISHISIKVKKQVFYLHNFNQQFHQFAMKITSDTDNKFYLTTKKDDNYFKLFDTYDTFIEDTFVKADLFNINPLTVFILAYLKHFILSYLATYCLNNSDAQIKDTITYILNNFKQV